MFGDLTAPPGCRGLCKRWAAERTGFPWQRLLPEAGSQSPWWSRWWESPLLFLCGPPDRPVQQYWKPETLEERKTGRYGHKQQKVNFGGPKRTIPVHMEKSSLNILLNFSFGHQHKDNKVKDNTGLINQPNCSEQSFQMYQTALLYASRSNFSQTKRLSSHVSLSSDWTGFVSSLQIRIQYAH